MVSSVGCVAVSRESPKLHIQILRSDYFLLFFKSLGLSAATVTILALECATSTVLVLTRVLAVLGKLWLQPKRRKLAISVRAAPYS